MILCCVAFSFVQMQELWFIEKACVRKHASSHIYRRFSGLIYLDSTQAAFLTWSVSSTYVVHVFFFRAHINRLEHSHAAHGRCRSAAEHFYFNRVYFCWQHSLCSKWMRNCSNFTINAKLKSTVFTSLPMSTFEFWYETEMVVYPKNRVICSWSNCPLSTS